MTPLEAFGKMKKIVKHAGDDPHGARNDGIELLCKIARMTGYYRTAEAFEEMVKRFSWAE